MTNPLVNPEFQPPSKQEELDQVYMLANCVSAMPSHIAGAPPVSIPPPIRAIWGKYLYDLGVRVHEDLATKQLVTRTPPKQGGHGPISRREIKRPNLLEQLRHINPEMAKRVESGEDPGALLDEIKQRASPNIEQAEAMVQQVKTQEEAARADDPT